jgi:predicted CopG family antitoxin
MKTPTTTITLNDKAYRILKDLKGPGESFSDVVIAHVRAPANTAAEWLTSIKEFEGANLINEELMKEVERGRKRKRK